MLDWKFLVLFKNWLFTELEEKLNTNRNIPTTNLKHDNPNVNPTHEDLSSLEKSENEQGVGNLSDDQQDERG